MIYRKNYSLLAMAYDYIKYYRFKWGLYQNPSFQMAKIERTTNGAATKKTFEDKDTFQNPIYTHIKYSKLECVILMAVVSILPHTEFGPNDHREDAPHFSIRVLGSPIHYCNSDKN